MEFAVLGSGSKGNCSVIRCNNTLIMVDCGFSLKEVEARMNQLAISGNEIDALLVTHEHSDHITGVAKLAARYDLAVYMTHGTSQYFNGRKQSIPSNTTLIHFDEAFTIGELRITPVLVPHDAKEPCQFIVESNQQRLGLLSDIGHISENVANAYQHCDALYIEFNHCKTMLAEGPYPAMLKRRVGGDWGHLSNCQAQGFVKSLEGGSLQHLIVGHVSEKNNHQSVVDEALQVFQSLKSIVVSEQHRIQPWLQLTK